MSRVTVSTTCDFLPALSAALARLGRKRYFLTMTATTSQTVEERVTKLEESVARLLAGSKERNPEAWRSVVGIFGDDELMKQMDEEGRRWRAEENRRSLS